MSDHIIMGIDPGTAITGYGIVSKSTKGLALIDFGCIRPPVKFTLSTRYKIIFEGIRTLVEKYSPQALAIETQFVHPRNPKVAITLGMARAAAILPASLLNVAIYEYTPKTVKLAATGLGNASKQQMQWMIQQHFKLKTLPEPVDAADALALAICHSNSFETSQRLKVF